MTAWMVVLLLGQAACAAVGLRVLAVSVAPRLPDATQTSSMVGDVWAPLAALAAAGVVCFTLAMRWFRWQ